VLVVDEAGMIGTRQMERVLSHARNAGAKVVLVGDPEQLQAIEAGAAFRSIAERHGAAEITEVRRQREDWQKDATRALATGRTAEALHAYESRGMVQAADTREGARGELVEGWDRQRQAEPDKTRIILTHTNAEVRELNQEARERVRASGGLGQDVGVTVDRGRRDFASGDRIMFLRNERSMGVKNGTLGTLEQVSEGRMAVRLDGGSRVVFDLKDYAHVDHGYAATIHKSQGVTVDRAHVLATPGMDRHGAYVALSRHREGVQLHYGRDDFTDQRQLARTLSRDRAKDMAGDYAVPSDQDRARAFAERREIRWPERAREIVHQVRDKARGMFDGFRPRPTPEKASASEREPAIGGKPDQTKAIERYARATADIGRMRAKGLPVLPHQEGALRKAGEVLDAGRPMPPATSLPRFGAIRSSSSRPLAATLAARRGRWPRNSACGSTRRRARAASWKPGRRCSGPAPPWSGRATVSALSGCAATWRRWPARSGATRSLNPRCAAARPSWR
jgi:hypothetical protein